MTQQQNPHQGVNGLIITAALVVIFWGTYQAQSVIVVMLVALFLAIIGAPPVLWLRERHIPSALAVIMVLAVMISIVLMTGGIVGTSLAGFSDGLPRYQKKITDEVEALRLFLAAKGIGMNDSTLLSYLNPGAVMSLTAGLLSGLTSTLSSFFLVLLTVTFILMEVSSFPGKLREIMNDPAADFSHYTKFFRDINRYMLVKTGIGALTGVSVGLWLSILGIDFPVLWGFLTFLLNYVPSLGIIVAAIPAVLLALVQFGSAKAFLTAAGFIIVNFIIGTVIEPRLVGKTAGLSTLVVFLSLVFWGNLLGLIGMVLCIPFTMTMKFFFEQHDQTRWLAVLLGPERTAKRKSGKAP